MNLSFRAKILAGIISIFLLYFMIFLYCIAIMRRAGGEIKTINNFYIPLIKTTGDLEDLHMEGLKKGYRTREKGTLKSLIFLSKTKFEKNLREGKERVKEWEGEVKDDSLFGAELRLTMGRLNEIEKIHKEYHSLYQKFVAGLDMEKGEEDISERISKRFDEITKKVRDLTTNLDRSMNAMSRMTMKTLIKSTWIALILATFSLLSGALMMVFTYTTLKPIDLLTEGAKRIGGGDLSHRVEVNSRDEIGTLAGEFNRMASSLREREERLLKAERLAAAGKIAYQITHEIRNPLNSISLNTELLEEEIEGLEDPGGEGGGNIREIFRAIKKETERLEEITGTYLEMGRPPTLRPEEDIRDVLSFTVNFLREEIEGQGVALAFHMKEGRVGAPVDGDKMKQALINVIKNALEAMKAGGRLEISLRDSDGWVRIDITDTGEGIRKEDLKMIFDPFFSRKKKGTGLGLAITQKIIEDHHGRVEVASEEGKGTTFSIYLPLAREGDGGKRAGDQGRIVPVEI